MECFMSISTDYISLKTDVFSREDVNEGKLEWNSVLLKDADDFEFFVKKVKIYNEEGEKLIEKLQRINFTVINSTYLLDTCRYCFRDFLSVRQIPKQHFYFALDQISNFKEEWREVKKGFQEVLDICTFNQSFLEKMQKENIDVTPIVSFQEFYIKVLDNELELNHIIRDDFLSFIMNNAHLIDEALDAYQSCLTRALEIENDNKRHIETDEYKELLSIFAGGLGKNIYVFEESTKRMKALVYKMIESTVDLSCNLPWKSQEVFMDVVGPNGTK